MVRQRKLNRWTWLFVVVVLGLVSAVMWGRLREPDAAQAAALDLLQQDLRPAHGRNAAAALWLADLDVPAAQLDALYAQDRQRMRAWLATVPAAGDPSTSFVDIAAGHRLPSMSDADKVLTCRGHDVDCLAQTSEHRDAVSALLSRQQQRLHNQQALAHYDYDWNEMPVDVEVAVPAYGAGHNLWSTSAALDFVDGHVSPALESVCTNALTRRRLHAHSNTLIGTTVADGQLQIASNLFLHMLARLPADQGLPEVCSQAFAVVQPEDARMCASAQEEFRLYGSMFERSYKVMTWWQKPLYKRSATLRLAAPVFAVACTDPGRAELLADHRFNDSNFPHVRPDWIDRIANPIGNSLLTLGQPSLGQYLNRHEDANAMLRLVATVMWLRETTTDGDPVNERLKQRPAWMRVDADRQLRVSADGRRIHMGYHSSTGKWPTEWPLAAAL